MQLNLAKKDTNHLFTCEVRCEEILPLVTWDSLRGAINAARLRELHNASSSASCLQAGSADGLDEPLGHRQAMGRLVPASDSPSSGGGVSGRRDMWLAGSHCLPATAVQRVGGKGRVGLGPSGGLLHSAVGSPGDINPTSAPQESWLRHFSAAQGRQPQPAARTSVATEGPPGTELPGSSGKLPREKRVAEGGWRKVCCIMNRNWLFLSAVIRF